MFACGTKTRLNLIVMFDTDMVVEYRPSNLFRTAAIALVLMASMAIINAQSLYRPDDPRWSDADNANDPNTCFEPGRNCRNRQDWENGWREARCLAGFPNCGGQTSDSRQPSDSGSSSSSSGGQQQSDSGSSSSTASGGQQQSDRRSSSSSRSRADRNRPPLPECPIGKVCVDYYPSGDHYVFNVGKNCCYPSQAIYYKEQAVIYARN